MNDEIQVTFACPRCGGGTISVEDEGREDSPVSCKGCGVRFDQSWGEIKQTSLHHAKSAFSSIIRRRRR